VDEDQRDPKIKEREARARAAAKGIGLILPDVKGWAGWFWLADPERGMRSLAAPSFRTLSQSKRWRRITEPAGPWPDAMGLPQQV
jgi:hypothetical protein